MHDARLTYRDRSKTPRVAWTAAVSVACMLGPARADDSQKGRAIDIGDRNQVFIDGRYLAQRQNVRIVVCPPKKTNEKCLVGGLRGYETILPVDGVFKGYHALSKNGATWRRVKPGDEPEADDLVGLYNGKPIVFVDRTAPPEQRYKRFQSNAIAASRDGVTWRTLHKKMFPAEAYFPGGMDSQNVCFHDPRLNKYVAYVRVNKAYPASAERREYFARASKRHSGKAGFYMLRTIGRSATENLSAFPMPDVVIEPDAKDPRFGGVGVMDFYTPQVLPYAEAQEAYFLFTARYLHYEDWYLADDLSEYPRSKAVGILNVGPLDIGFAASRDGIHWRRYDRRPWIPLGRKGAFDSKQMYSARGMVFHDEEIWMYYVGYDTLHGGKTDVERTPVLSRVVLTRDRFTAVEANYEGGEFATPPLRFRGKELFLNIETSALGLARVEIQDAAGRPIEGFALKDCDRIHTTNTLRQGVTWRAGHSSVAALQDRPVRLRFQLQFGAKLYAFRFASDDGDSG